jgi:GR25 family glycosyltransferase involved in LPS biosynthesis
MLNVEKIFVTHYTRLVERKQKLDGYFRENNIKANYIYEFDKDNLTDDLIKEYYLCDEKKYNDTIVSLYKENCVPFRKLNMAEISLTIKHYHAVKRISEECKEYGLILEDDVIFENNFINLFNNFLEKTPKDWDVIFMGNCCNLRIDKSLIKPGQIAYLKNHPATKGADSFLIKTELAKKIVNTMKPFNAISDWEYAYQFFVNNAKVYWWEPPIISQGSENGLYKSTLR